MRKERDKSADFPSHERLELACEIGASKKPPSPELKMAIDGTVSPSPARRERVRCPARVPSWLSRFLA
jgi:hypothetical protein